MAQPSSDDSPLDLQLTYPGLIEYLAEKAPEAQGVRDLPELTLEHLALAVRRWPASLIDAMAEYDGAHADCLAHTLSQTSHSALSRYGQVGCLVVGAVRDYVLPLILKDVQAVLERRRAAELIEQTPTGVQSQVVELGSRRTLQS